MVSAKIENDIMPTLSKVALKAQQDFTKRNKGTDINNLDSEEFIENGENPVEAMIRETREEAGLAVCPETIKEYGYVHRIRVDFFLPFFRQRGGRKTCTLSERRRDVQLP